MSNTNHSAAAESRESGSRPSQDDSPPLTGDELLRYVSRLKRQIITLNSSLLGPETESHGIGSNDEELPKMTLEKIHGLERNGTFKNVEKTLSDRCVAIIGLGRVGSRVSSLLAKSGIGKFLLVDVGKVTFQDLEGSGFQQQHIGLPKSQAARMLVFENNPEAIVRGETLDVLMEQDASVLQKKMKNFEQCLDKKMEQRNPEIDGKKVDVVISCLDSRESREIINHFCLDLNIPCFNVQIDDDCTTASINFLIPGKTACLDCLISKEEASQSVRRRPGDSQHHHPQHGNLRMQRNKMDFPGVSLMLAGLVSQNVVKHFLGRGIVLPSFKFRFNADSHVLLHGNVSSTIMNMHADPSNTATQFLPSKEFQSFRVEPFVRCPNLFCRDHQVAQGCKNVL